MVVLRGKSAPNVAPLGMVRRMSGENPSMASSEPHARATGRVARVDRILELIDVQLAEYDAWRAPAAQGALTARPTDDLRLTA